MRFVGFSYSEQEAFLLRIFESLGGLDQYSIELKRRNLCSFIAWQEFERQCCGEPSEINSLSTYSVARAKAFFCRPDGFLGKARSAQLNEYCPWASRWDGGVLDGAAEARRRELESIRATALISYRQCEFDVWERSHDSGKITALSYAMIFRDAICKRFGNLGFKLDKVRSSDDFPVISKQVVPGLDLCWSAGSRRTLRHWPRPSDSAVERWTQIEMCCYLAVANYCGEANLQIGFKSSKIIILRLGRFVDGFDWSYSRINGLEQLEFCIGSHASLYDVLSAALDASLGDIFGKLQ